MTFRQAVITCFRKYAVFHGRARRPEFWWWALFTVLISLVTLVLDFLFLRLVFGPQATELDALTGPFGLIAGVVLFLPSLSVSARRLHDIGRTAYWLFISLIPLLGWLVLFYWHLLASTKAKTPYD